MQIKLLIVLVAGGLLPFVSCHEGGFAGGWVNTDHDETSGPFTVISGPMEDDSAEDQIVWPWRHHVDFDERFPGEDQIAVESEYPTGRRVPAPNNFRHRNHHSSENEDSSEEHSPFNGSPISHSDDIIVPDFTRMFNNVHLGPAISTPPPPPTPSIATFNINTWVQQLMKAYEKSQPWWKGSNVCIKREETEESSITDGPTLPSRASSEEDNEESDENQSGPEFQMHISACEDHDTKYKCTTRLFGPQVIKTVLTEYECCHGYGLDKKKESCVRGKYADVATTIDQLGATEFLTLVEKAKLMDKFKMVNVTVFAPTDEAVAAFLNEHSVETNEIEAMRRRRSILSHGHSEPGGGRNVRRRPISHDQEQQHYSRYMSQRHRGHARAFQRPTETSSEEGDTDKIPDETLDDWKSDALFQRQKKLVSYSHDDHDGVENNVVELQQTLLNHFISGKLSTDDFVDEQVVFSEGGDGDSSGSSGGVLRLNTWNVGGERVKTVNCARLTSINNRCTNGIVHLVDRVFTPVTKNIAQYIQTTPQLSLWASLISSSGELSLLVDPQQHLTLFAPTNAALQKLGPAMILKLQNGDTCLKRILRRHILPLTFCTSIVYGEGQVRTIDDDLLDISRTADDKLLINGSLIVTRDIVTTNGVVHIIEDVILSDSDQPLTTALGRSGQYKKFLQLVKSVGLTQQLDTLNNVTVFAPNDDAFATLPQEILSNPAKLKEILMYHVSTPEVRACRFAHQQELSTLNENQTININLYSSFPFGAEAQITAQCGKIMRTNELACNGVIHQIDRVLIPSDYDLMKTLATQPDLSIFTRLLKEHTEILKLLTASDGFHTVFAPTDSAFYKMPQDAFERVLNDTETATDMLKRHITADSLCCSGVAPSLYFLTHRVSTLGPVNVPVYRDPAGHVMFGHTQVTTCDLTASNGIIHAIDTVLMKRLDDEDNGRSLEKVGDCGRIPQQLQSLFFRL